MYLAYKRRRDQMSHTTWVSLSLIILAVVTLPSQTVFAGDAAVSIRVDTSNGQTIYNEGKGDATACVGCHGGKGLGMDAMGAPRLANVGQQYVFKQLNDYATDKRADPGMGAMMNGIAKALNDQDRRDVAAYLDSLANEADPSDLKALAASGKVGDPNKGMIIMTNGVKPLVPACHDCHGLSGHAPNVPAIHQQKYVYLVNQLNRYRDGTRANDHEVYEVGIMRGIAKKLTDENIADISAYLATVTNLTP
jgi:cytochrome c553